MAKFCPSDDELAPDQTPVGDDVGDDPVEAQLVLFQHIGERLGLPATGVQHPAHPGIGDAIMDGHDERDERRPGLRGNAVPLQECLRIEDLCLRNLPSLLSLRNLPVGHFPCHVVLVLLCRSDF